MNLFRQSDRPVARFGHAIRCANRCRRLRLGCCDRVDRLLQAVDSARVTHVTSVCLNVSARIAETLVIRDFLFGISLMFQCYLRNDLFRYSETAPFRDSLRDGLGSITTYGVRGCVVAVLFASPATLSMLHWL